MSKGLLGFVVTTGSLVWNVKQAEQIGELSRRLSAVSDELAHARHRYKQSEAARSVLLHERDAARVSLHDEEVARRAAEQALAKERAAREATQRELEELRQSLNTEPNPE